MHLVEFMLRYGSLAGVVILTSLGAGIGGGIASKAGLEAMMRAPAARGPVMRALIIGLALIETGSILGVVIALLLLGTHPISSEALLSYSLGHAGILCALGITGVIVGICCAQAMGKALYAIARQPLFSNKITNVMLLTQTIIQTPIIFAFLVSLIIYAQLGSAVDYVAGMRLLAAGLCIGVGTIGPIIGLMYFARSAMEAIAINRDAYTKVVPFAFLSQAIIETPIIFALLISVIIALVPLPMGQGMVAVVATMAAALVMGFGTLSPGISSGKTAATACQQMAIVPDMATTLSRTSIVAQGIIDASAIYAFLVALMSLIFR